MRIFVMMGTTLAGKTRHGKQLAKELGCEYIASGDIARSLMDEKTKEEFAQGKLSPHDEKIRQAIYERILGAISCGGVVLDGFPRNAAHVIDFITWLEDWIQQGGHNRASVIVVRLDVPASVIVARASLRERDQFDTSEIALKRHGLYLNETAPALEYLARVYGNVATITLVAEADFEHVHNAIMGELEDKQII